jgi:protein-L-isoaspartate O-methyltransferase
LLQEAFKILQWYAKEFLKIPYEAFQELRTLLEDYYWDKRLSVHTCGLYEEKKNLGLNKDAKIYEATSYSDIWRMIAYLKLEHNDVAMDFGCGKGRVVFLLAKENLKKISGIELDEGMASIAKQNIKTTKLDDSKVQIIIGDAAAYRIYEETFFCIFNPFGSKTLNQVVINMKESQTKNPRKIRIAYCGPYGSLFDTQTWLEREGRIEKTEIFVWRSILLN